MERLHGLIAPAVSSQLSSGPGRRIGDDHRHAAPRTDTGSIDGFPSAREESRGRGRISEGASLPAGSAAPFPVSPGLPGYVRKVRPGAFRAALVSAYGRLRYGVRSPPSTQCRRSTCRGLRPVGFITFVHFPPLSFACCRSRIAHPVQRCPPRAAPHAVRNHPPRPCCVCVATVAQHATDTHPRLPSSCVMRVLRSPWNTRPTQSAVEPSPCPFPKTVNLPFFPFHTYAPLVRQQMLHWSVAPEVALLCYTFRVRRNEEGPADDPGWQSAPTPDRATEGLAASRCNRGSLGRETRAGPDPDSPPRPHGCRSGSTAPGPRRPATATAVARLDGRPGSRRGNACGHNRATGFASWSTPFRIGRPPAWCCQTSEKEEAPLSR